MRNILQQENGIPLRQANVRRRSTRFGREMQPAFAVQHDVETRPLMTRCRGLPVATVLADMEQRAFQFQAGKQPIGDFFWMSEHNSLFEVQRSVLIINLRSNTKQRTSSLIDIPIPHVRDAAKRRSEPVIPSSSNAETCHSASYVTAPDFGRCRCSSSFFRRRFHISHIRSTVA